jgi:hypothetical protein
LIRSSPERLVIEVDRVGTVLSMELVPDLAVARELVCVSKASEQNLHAFLRLTSVALRPPPR